jgi:hypothetical protein
MIQEFDTMEKCQAFRLGKPGTSSCQFEDRIKGYKEVEPTTEFSREAAVFAKKYI